MEFFMRFNKNHPAFSHLPERLTISFPIWCLYDIDGKGAYADTDRIVREHVERGFNCIRFDDGAGLMHDLDGNPRGKIKLGDAFGDYDKILRQFDAIGGTGYCDPLERMIKLAESAKKHGVYLILSSWYYLHTYWFLHDKALNDELFSIPDNEKFMAFAKFLHYIILELKKRDLQDCIAFAEIFNEADGLYFTTAYTPERYSDEEHKIFRENHEKAIMWLEEMHPDILFAYDSFTVETDLRVIPESVQVFNFHSYYLWSIYSKTAEESPDCFTPAVTAEEARAAHTSRRDEIEENGWYQRIARYSGLIPDMIPTLEDRLESRLQREFDRYLNKAFIAVDTVKKIRERFPDVPIVSGEGVTYIGSKELLWEEHSELYWKLLEEVSKKYREIGIWGTVVRTCSGPEDPSWNSVPEKLLKINRAFLGQS